MTDKKYTDEQIVKALRSWISSHDCDIICIKESMNCDWCLVELLKQTFFLINRQKAEIERWQKFGYTVGELARDRKEEIGRLKKEKETARAEAIEEFAERLRASCDAPYWCVWLSEIDEIAKELTEGRQ